TDRLSSLVFVQFFVSSSRRHTIFSRDWSSDVCSSDLQPVAQALVEGVPRLLALPVTLVHTTREQADSQERRAVVGEEYADRPHRSEERRVGKECRASSTPQH